MTVCGAVGALMVGGRVVGQIKCELNAGHNETNPHCSVASCGVHEVTPHSMTLTWTPEAEPDLDLFDPAEKMDVEVPLTEAEIQHDGYRSIGNHGSQRDGRFGDEADGLGRE